MSRRSEHPLFRAAALVATLCILALTVLATSPQMHAGLHSPDATTEHAAPVCDPNHACAVCLFAQGVSAPLAFFLLMPGLLLAAVIIVRAADEIAAAQPRYRLVPSHAPPGSLS